MSWDGVGTLRKVGVNAATQSTIDQRTTDLNGITLYQNNTNSQDLYGTFLADGVPVTPVTLAENTETSSGSLISAANITLTASGDILNDATIQSSGNLGITASNVTNNGGSILASGDISAKVSGDLTDNSGVISSTGNLLLEAGNDVKLTSSTLSAGGTLGISAGHDLTDNSSAISSTGNLFLKTGNDINLTASTLSAGGALGMLAGHDINFNTTISTGTLKSDDPHTTGTTTTNNLTSITSGGDMAIFASNDLTSHGAQLTSGGSLDLGADNNLNLLSVVNNTKSQTNTSGNHWTDALTSDTNTVVGNSLKAAGNINLDAGKTLTLQASNATSANGAVNLVADTVNLTTADQQSTSNEQYVYKKSGLFSSTKITKTTTDVNQAIGSSLSGNSINITSVGDTNLTGASVIGSNGVDMQAGGNMNIQAATSTASVDSVTIVKKSGFFSGGLLGFSIGSQTQKTTTTDSATQLSGSTVGALGGNVGLSATNTYTQTASTVQANNGDVSIQAGAVNIQAGNETDKNTVDTIFKQTALTFSLGGSIATAAAGAVTSAQSLLNNAKASGSTRSQALAAGAEGLSLYNAGTAAYSNFSKGGTGSILGTGTNSGIRVSVSLGTSESQSHSETDTTTAIGSSVNGNNVSITATGTGGGNGNLNVIGSSINGTNNVSLAAANDLNLLAAQDTSTSKSTSSSYSASIGASFNVGGKAGMGLGLNASLSGGMGNSQSASTTNVNTTVDAGNNLTLTSGANTTLSGAVASGKQIIANAGGDLLIKSLQDTSTYSSSNKSAGISAGAGVSSAGLSGFSVSGSLSMNKSTSNYASVQQQSALSAGAGGYQVRVTGNTALKGGAISSTAPASANSLTTGTLTTSDIENHASYNASQMSIGIGYGTTGGSLGGFSAAPPSAMTAKGSASSTTQSAISSGTTTITDEAGQQAKTGKTAEQTIAGLDRDTTSTQNSLKPIYDQQKIEAAFQITAAFAQQTGQFLANKAASADKKLDDAKAKVDQEKNDPTLTDAQRKDLLTQAEEDTNQAAPWVSGGTYRQIGMALAAAASGNVTGSTGDLLKTAVVDWVQQQGAAEIGKLVEQGTIQEGSPEHAALHSIIACAGAAASDQSCSSAAMGAAATSALSNIFLDKNSNMTDQQKETRAQLIETITAGVASAVGADPTAALTASQSEADNNLNKKDIEALKKKISGQLSYFYVKGGNGQGIGVNDIKVGPFKLDFIQRKGQDVTSTTNGKKEENVDEVGAKIGFGPLKAGLSRTTTQEDGQLPKTEWVPGYSLEKFEGENAQIGFGIGGCAILCGKAEVGIQADKALKDVYNAVGGWKNILPLTTVH